MRSGARPRDQRPLRLCDDRWCTDPARIPASSRWHYHERATAAERAEQDADDIATALAEQWDHLQETTHAR